VDLEIFQDGFAIYVLMLRDIPDDAIEGADTKNFVCRDRDSMRDWSRRLQDNVTADLMDLCVLPVPAEVIGEFQTAEVAGKLHAMASNSSRTRRRRMAAGFFSSKK